MGGKDTQSRRRFLTRVSAVGVPAFGRRADERPTRLLLDLPASVDDGVVTLSGELRDVSGSEPEGIPNAEIRLRDRNEGFVDDLNFEPNRLTTATTRADGRFTLRWNAERVGNSKDVETEVRFPGSEEYDSSRAPRADRYPITVEPSVVPYDYRVTYRPTTDVLVRGTTAKNPVLVTTVSGFRADPPRSVPPIALAVGGLPDEAYHLSPTVDKPITYNTLLAGGAPTRAFVGTFTIDASQLSTGVHSFTALGSSLNIDRGWSGTKSHRVRVVPRTVTGTRLYTYDLLARFLAPAWWRFGGAVTYVQAGIDDPIEYSLDVLESVFTDIVKRPSPTKPATAALDQLIDTFTETLVPLLDGLQKVSVATVLDESADSAAVDANAVVENLDATIQSEIRNQQYERATAVIRDTLGEVESWLASAESEYGSENPPSRIATTVLEETIRFLRAELETGRETTASQSGRQLEVASYNICTGAYCRGRNGGNTDALVLEHEDTISVFVELSDDLGESSVTVEFVGPSGETLEERTVDGSVITADVSIRELGAGSGVFAFTVEGHPDGTWKVRIKINGEVRVTESFELRRAS